jgi:hypothetical protein
MWRSIFAGRTLRPVDLGGHVSADWRNIAIAIATQNVAGRGFSSLEDNQRTREAGPERIVRTSRGGRDCKPEPKSKEKEESAAIKRRSRCEFIRGNPVLNSHFSPGPAPQVGQRVASIFLAVGFVVFTVVNGAAYRQGKMVNFAQ